MMIRATPNTEYEHAATLAEVNKWRDEPRTACQRHANDDLDEAVKRKRDNFKRRHRGTR